MSGVARRALSVAVLLTAAAALRAAAPAAEAPTEIYLRALTSVRQHLEEGEFSAPRGLFFDRRRDELWIADTGNTLIGVFTPEGMPLHTAAPGPEIREPTRLVVTADERVLLLDSDRSRVAVLDWRGRAVGRLELPGLPEKPVLGAIAVDERGQIYVGENSVGEVLVYSPELRLRFRFGNAGDGDGEFRSIADIEVTADRILVVDHLARPVQIFDRRGNFLAGFGAHQLGAENFSLPEAIAVDSKGRLVIVDALRHEIKLFSPEGRFLGRFGGHGRGPGNVLGPCDVAVDGRDRIFVAERTNGRVQVFEELEVPVTPRERRRPARRTRD